MKKLLFITALIIVALLMLSCSSSRLVSYKPNKKCSTPYNDVTALDKRQDIPRSLRMDYKKYK